MQILELFAGIGGATAALEGHEVVCAIDHDEHAARTYALNWSHPIRRTNLVSLKPAKVPAADLWWMSPPCQPFTVRGERRDLDDPRCAPFLRVLELVEALRPRHIALENVATFAGSRAHLRMRDLLDRCGYAVRERELCPGELGVPNKRPRFYLLASQDPLQPWRPTVRTPRPLAAYLDADPNPSLFVPEALLERYRDALAVTDLDHPDPQTHCFTGAYGKSPVYAGSYLREARGVRWFSPEEVVRLLGFPASFRFPDDVSLPKRYKLAGNSLSVVAVREVLAHLHSST